MGKDYIYSFIVFLSLLTTSFPSRSEDLINTAYKNPPTNSFIGNTSSKSQLKSKTLKISSWNIRDLGRSKDAEEINKIAKTIKDFDIVALQEVVAKDPAGAQAVAKIVDELNRMGNKWDYRISDPTKSPSAYISERYAFLWKTSKVKLTSRAYLDSELEDLCYREPYIGKFQIKSSSNILPFYVINFHSRKFNDHPEKEIINLKEYSKRLHSDNIIILGDFNLNETHEVWNDLYDNGFKPALKNTKTTLKRKCKDSIYLNHSIDNIYYSKSFTAISSGSIDIVGSCSNLESARALSDHLPIFLEVKK